MPDRMEFPQAWLFFKAELWGALRDPLAWLAATLEDLSWCCERRRQACREMAILGHMAKTTEDWNKVVAWDLGRMAERWADDAKEREDA